MATFFAQLVQQRFVHEFTVIVTTIISQQNMDQVKGLDKMDSAVFCTGNFIDLNWQGNLTQTLTLTLIPTQNVVIDRPKIV